MALVLISAVLILHLALRKKIFFNFSEFQLNILRVEKAFCINQYFLKVSKLMNQDLAHNKVYNYFNIGDAKALVKLKKK